MSTIRITDKKGGVYEAAIDFSYGECERLPFNILRRVRARLRVLGGGGLTATATFNIRNPQESNAFLEILGLFGEEGSYRHGSSVDAKTLSQTVPPPEMEGGWDDDELEIEGTLTE